jgi:hypothetical protein
MTLTVAAVPPFKVPIEQVTVPAFAGQLVCPGALFAETNVALADEITSVKVMPVVKSPWFVTV